MRGHLQQANQEKRGRVLAFIGAKGGVGTTTVALNTATLLARQHQTLFVELRPDYGTAAAQLNEKPSRTIGHLIATSAQPVTELEVRSHLQQGASGLHLLFSPQRPADFCSLGADYVESLLQATRRLAARVVLDLPPHPSDATRAALEHCDQIALITEPEPAAISATRVMLDLFDSWQVGSSLAALIIVRRSASAIPLSIKEMETQLERKIAGVIPPAADVCSRATISGKPIVLEQPAHIACTSIAEITRNLAASLMPAAAR
jgi:pilus assembly protein CpaE